MFFHKINFAQWIDNRQLPGHIDFVDFFASFYPVLIYFLFFFGIYQTQVMKQKLFQ